MTCMPLPLRYHSPGQKARRACGAPLPETRTVFRPRFCHSFVVLFCRKSWYSKIIFIQRMRSNALAGSCGIWRCEVGELVLVLIITCIVCGGVPLFAFVYMNGKQKNPIAIPPRPRIKHLRPESLIRKFFCVWR